MPLARAICGGWWASEFTCVFLKLHCNDNSMARFFAPQKAPVRQKD
jgi:hypothetical protein